MSIRTEYFGAFVEQSASCFASFMPGGSLWCIPACQLRPLPSHLALSLLILLAGCLYGQ